MIIIDVIGELLTIVVNQSFGELKKGNRENMPYAITQRLKEKLNKVAEKGMNRGKRKAAKSLIGIYQDEIIAQKVGMSLEDVKKLHAISRHKS